MLEGMRYLVMKEVPPRIPPYLAGTSNNKDLADAMCIYLCRQNPACLAWVEPAEPSSSDKPVSLSGKRYWAMYVKRGGGEE